jgi:hypothetical protein
MVRSEEGLINMARKRPGWFGESLRHSLASRGVKTKRASNPIDMIARPKLSTKKPLGPPEGVKTMSKDEFEHGYVYGFYPGLTGYGYQADFISEEDAKAIMERIMKKVAWIEDTERGSPILHMKDGSELDVGDTEDFPKPTDEGIEGEREREYEREYGGGH